MTSWRYRKGGLLRRRSVSGGLRITLPRLSLGAPQANPVGNKDATRASADKVCRPKECEECYERAERNATRSSARPQRPKTAVERRCVGRTEKRTRVPL
ncbi:hypothetical protein NDU88_006068 [Pleurodeles waltl]|uniref:Uncharacterized protein n=1 Tax=Pleurodeles waltl TaxID=8319 RepID=A0AAV7SNP7_PLEWA|nr:hypothetical protein NDU88_006068 [Pleurodeles waltl]